MATAILAMPSYGQVHPGAAVAFWGSPSLGKTRCLPCAHSSSLLAYGFNCLWHQAYQMRKREHPEADFFCMLHADVVPQAGWVDVLVDELERTGADVVSVVVPIKDARGLTSTAIENPADEWEPRCLTLREVHRLPETFGIEDAGYRDGRALLVNTGCWIADFRKPWCRDVAFTIRDAVDWPDGPEGMPRVRVIPEDWGFSRWLHRRGGKVLATRRVLVEHKGGDGGYPNRLGPVESEPVNELDPRAAHDAARDQLVSLDRKIHDAMRRYNGAQTPAEAAAAEMELAQLTRQRDAAARDNRNAALTLKRV